MVHRASSVLVALSMTLAVACGDSGGTTGSNTDTTTNTDTGLDTGGTTTTTTTSPDTTVTEPGDHAGFVEAESNFDTDSSFTLFQAVNGTTEPYDVLSIEIYNSSTFIGGADGPGTYSLDDSNYETCANCVLVRSACSDADGCDKVFYADEGDLVITQWDVTGGFFKGSLEGVVLHEVTIDPESYHSTLVADGGTWTIDHFEFTGEIKALPVSDKTQETCVAEGTGNLLHDNVGNLTLKNCNGDDVQLHATCGGESKALWLIGTTGWCTACHEFLDAFRNKHTPTGILTREIIAEKTPGLDMLIILAENNQGNEPTQAFCKAYAEDMKIDPAMIVIDWTDKEVEVPLVDPEGSSIVTQALGNTWGFINPYLVADTQGSVTTAYPWWAILNAKNMEYIWSDGGAIITFDQALEELLGAFPEALFE